MTKKLIRNREKNKKNIKNFSTLAAIISGLFIGTTCSYATDVTNWTDLKNSIETNGEATLTTDIIEENGVDYADAGNFNLNLNGHTIQTHGLDEPNSAPLFYSWGGNTVTLSNGVIQNAYLDNQNIPGGAVLSLGDTIQATINNVAFNNNYAVGQIYGVPISDFSGGAVYLIASNINITNSSFYKNGIHAQEEHGVVTPKGGAAYLEGISFGEYQPVVTISNTSFTDNKSTEIGGALYLASDSREMGIVNYNINNNSSFKSNSSDNGGAIYVDGLADINLTLQNTSFNDNTATTKGGAIYITDRDEKGNVKNLTVSNSTLKSNSATDGGAIYITTTTEGSNTKNLKVSNTSFTNNTATNNGGAIYLNKADTVTFTDTIFMGNTALEGSAIYNNTSAEMKFIASAESEETDAVIISNSNKASSGIYTKGNLFFDAAEGKRIVIDDVIKISPSSAININQNLGTGIVEINNYVNNLEGQNGYNILGLSSGTLKMNGNGANQTIYELYTTGGTIDLQNDTAGDNLIVTKINGTNSTNFKADYDASSGAMDKLTINGIEGTNPTITLSSINVTQDGNATSGEYLDGSARANVNVISTPINVVSSGGTTYIFTPTETHGLLTVSKNAGNKTLPETIADSGFSTYSLTGDYITPANLGTLAGNGRVFTLEGNSHLLNGGNYSGITVNAGQTLNINGFTNANNTSSIQNFSSNNEGSVINNSGTLNISNSSFVNNKGGDTRGGVIANNENAVLTITATQDMSFDGNSVVNSGGVISNGGTVNITANGGKITFNNNKATYQEYSEGGAIENYGGSINFNANSSDIVFSSNTGLYGGAIMNAGELTTSAQTNNGIFFKNNTGVMGGAIYNIDTLNLTQKSVFDTNTGVHGGAIYAGNNTTIGNNSEFTNNTATNTNYSNAQSMGGAIAKTMESGTLTIGDNALFKNNSAISVNGEIPSMGGAIANLDGAITIGNNATFDNNSAGYGGAIANEEQNIGYPDEGTLTIGDNATFTNNSANFDGGVFDGLGTIIVGNNAQFVNNRARVKGGVSSTYSPITIGTNATFSNNSADRGGAIFNWGENSSIGSGATFTGNSAVRQGGAIANMYDYEKTDFILPHHNITMTVTDATFGDGTDNNANRAIQGGAIANTETLTINGSATFNKNIANEGGAIYNFIDNNSYGIVTLNATTGNIVFKNNVSNTNKGGAIYNTNTVNIIATGENKVSFETNSDTIYNTGNLNLQSGNIEINAAIQDADTKAGATTIQNANVILGDNATISQKNLTVQSGSLTTNASNFNVSNAIKNTGTINLTGGTLNNSIVADNNAETNVINITTSPVELASQITNQNIFVTNELVANKTQDFIGVTNNLTLSGNGVLNMQDSNKTMNTVSVNNLTLNGENAGFKIDTDFTNETQTSDRINISGIGAGTANLTSINVKNGFGGDIGTTKTITLVTGENINNLKLNPTTTSTGLVSYEFKAGENPGEVVVTKADGYSLPVSISSYGANDGVATYSLSKDLVMNEDLGTLSRNDAGDPREFTINGNNNGIDGQNKYEGITVQIGDTLTLENINSFKNYETVVTNAGKTVVRNVQFANNTKDIINNGTLEFSGEGSSLSGGISGIGSSTLNTSLTTNNGTIEQYNFLIGEDGTLTSNASNVTVTNGIINNGSYIFVGGENKNIITGNGTVTVNGNVTNNATIGNSVVINAEKSLTSSASNINENITNNGSLIFNAGENKNEITGTGTVTIAERTANSNNINQERVVVNAVLTNNGEITTSTISLDNDIIGVGSFALSGNNNISDKDFSITQNTITNTGNLTAKAGQISANVKNNSNYYLVGGEKEAFVNKNIITGTGITHISNEVENTGTIEQNIQNTGIFTSSADNVKATIQNNGEYNIKGGTIAYNITGNGNINLYGNVTNNQDVSDFNGEVVLKENSKLTLGEGTLFTESASFTAENNSTINLINNNAQDITLNELIIDEDNNVNLEIDWKDKLSSTNTDKINGNVNISKVNLKNQLENDSYKVTNFNDKVVVDLQKVVIEKGENSANFLSFNAEDGTLTTKVVDSLETAVTNADTGENLYTLSGNETANDSVLSQGEFIIEGNGYALTNSGITVGDGTGANVTLMLRDTNIENVQIEGEEKGAITVRGGTEVFINAENGNVTLEGTNNPTGDNNIIYLKKEGGNASKVTLNANQHKIIINDDIRSNSVDNEVIFIGKDFDVKGTLDPETVTVTANVNRSGENVYDEQITYNLNDGGTLTYTNDKILYEEGYHDVNNYYNTINFNGGSLDLRNGTASTIHLAGLNVNQNSNLYLDVDLTTEHGNMDKLASNAPVTVADGQQITVAGLAIKDNASSTSKTINFTEDVTLKNAIKYDASEVEGTIYKYNVSYNGDNGDFDFKQQGGSFSPSVLASPVAAQMGSYIAQINSYEQAFTNMDMTMVMTHAQRTAMKHANKYALAGDIDANGVEAPTVIKRINTNGNYQMTQSTQDISSSETPIYDDDVQIPEQNRGIWFRPYATFESVNMNNAPKVKNNLYGVFVGGDSDIISLAHGWDAVYSGYLAYNGSHQTYNGNGIYQNGAQVGGSAVFYNDNFFTGITANFGANFANASTTFGSENFTSLATGAASKSGYNWELAGGKFIVQPSFLVSYTFVNTFDYTNAAGVRITSDPLNAIQIAPGLKFIGNLNNGWQPYLAAQMMWNLLDKAKYKADNVNLPELSVDPYFQYGLGVQKRVGKTFTTNGQVMMRNGGRTGVAMELGMRWALGRK